MNYYNILGLKSTASQEEIKVAYKKLIKKYHPDIYKGDKTFAEKKTAEINVAYDVLSNPVSKKEYDDSIAPKYSYTPPKYDYTSSYNTYKNNNSNTYSSGYYNSNRRSYSSNSYSYRNYNTSNNRTNTKQNVSYSSTSDGSEHDYSTYANYERKYTDYHRSTTPNSNYTYYTNYSNDNFTDRLANHMDKITAKDPLKFWYVTLIFYIIAIIISTVQVADIFSTNTSKDRNNTVSKNYSSYSASQKHSNETTTNSIDKAYENSNIKNYFSKEEALDLYNLYSRQTKTPITFEKFLTILELYVNEDF